MLPHGHALHSSLMHCTKRSLARKRCGSANGSANGSASLSKITVLLAPRKQIQFIKLAKLIHPKKLFICFLVLYLIINILFSNSSFYS